MSIEEQNLRQFAYMGSPEFKAHILDGGSPVERTAQNNFAARIRNAVLSYRGVDGKAPKDLWGYIVDMPLRVLGFRGMDGKAPKDAWGYLVDGARDTVDALLSRRLRSTYDGKEYRLQDFIVVTNERANAGDVKLNAILEALTCLTRDDKTGAAAAIDAAARILAETKTPTTKEIPK